MPSFCVASQQQSNLPPFLRCYTEAAFKDLVSANYVATAKLSNNLNR